jgi:hypothetical protein
MVATDVMGEIKAKKSREVRCRLPAAAVVQFQLFSKFANGSLFRFIV